MHAAHSRFYDNALYIFTFTYLLRHSSAKLMEPHSTVSICTTPRWCVVDNFTNNSTPAEQQYANVTHWQQSN